jgi:hypothetical protein
MIVNIIAGSFYDVQAGKYVTSDVSRSLVVVISNASLLQNYAVRTLYRVFAAWDGQVLFEAYCNSKLFILISWISIFNTLLQ